MAKSGHGGPYAGIGGANRGVLARLYKNGTLDPTLNTEIPGGWVTLIRAARR